MKKPQTPRENVQTVVKATPSLECAGSTALFRQGDRSVGKKSSVELEHITACGSTRPREVPQPASVHGLPLFAITKTGWRAPCSALFHLSIQTEGAGLQGPRISVSRHGTARTPEASQRVAGRSSEQRAIPPDRIGEGPHPGRGASGAAPPAGVGIENTVTGGVVAEAPQPPATSLGRLRRRCRFAARHGRQRHRL